MPLPPTPCVSRLIYTEPVEVLARLYNQDFVFGNSRLQMPEYSDGGQAGGQAGKNQIISGSYDNQTRPMLLPLRTILPPGRW